MNPLQLEELLDTALMHHIVKQHANDRQNLGGFGRLGIYDWEFQGLAIQALVVRMFFVQGLLSSIGPKIRGSTF